MRITAKYLFPPLFFFLLLLLLLITTSFPIAQACGVLVHNEVLRRAIHLYSLPSTHNASLEDSARARFSTYLSSPNSAPVVQAGAFFPDWGYNCLWSDQDSEAAHWPPFQKAWAEYVVGKYGLQGNEPREMGLSEEEEQHLRTLVAFGFAIASHQSSDETWHSIRLTSGFLRSVAVNDFYSNMADAHSTIDIGGDIIFATRFTVPHGSSWLSSSWSFPIADIVAVYARMGRSVSAAKLRSCAIRGLAALKTELSIGPRWYEQYAGKSPTTITEIDGYFLGGVEEMAGSTVGCWGGLTRWYVYGTPDDKGDEWNLCDVFRAWLGGTDGEISHGKRTFTSLRDEKDFADALEAAEQHISLVSTNKFGVETYVYLDTPSLYSPPASPPPVYEKSLPPSPDPSLPKFSEPTYISPYTPYSQFGHALTLGPIGPDLSNPSLHIAVTAPLETDDSNHPNAGGVYILPLDQLSTQLSSQSTPNKYKLTPLTNSQHEPPRINSRFGHALTTFNPGSSSNNNTLLAISSPGGQTFNPSLSPTQHPAGGIDIFLGGQKIQTWRVQGAALGGRGVKFWGEVLASGELLEGEGEVLVVGSPMSDSEGDWGCLRWGDGVQRGFVTVVRVGGAEGADVKVNTKPGIEILVHNQDSLPQSIKSWTIQPPSSPPAPPHSGPDPCTLPTPPPPRFGSSLLVTPHSKTLLVGAPGRNTVYAYKYDPVVDEFRVVFNITLPGAARGGKRIDFGHSLAVGVLVTPGGEKVEWIAVSSPGEGAGNGRVRIYIPHDAREEEGGVRLIAEIRDEDGDRDRERERGKGTGFVGFGRALLSTPGGLFVASAFAEKERGAVWWVPVEDVIALSVSPQLHGNHGQQVVLPGGILGVQQVKAKKILLGPEGRKAGFGEAMVWVGADGSKVAGGGKGGKLVVGMKYAGTGEGLGGKRLTGAVAVFEQVEAGAW